MPVHVRAAEPAALLAAFLTELVHLAAGERFAATRLHGIVLEPGGARASVWGVTGAVRPLVEQIDIVRVEGSDAGWLAIVAPRRSGPADPDAHEERSAPCRS